MDRIQARRHGAGILLIVAVVYVSCRIGCLRRVRDAVVRKRASSLRITIVITSKSTAAYAWRMVHSQESRVSGTISPSQERMQQSQPVSDVVHAGGCSILDGARPVICIATCASMLESARGLSRAAAMKAAAGDLQHIGKGA